MKTQLYFPLHVIAFLFLVQSSFLVRAQTHTIQIGSNFELQHKGNELKLLNRSSGEIVFTKLTGQCLSIKNDLADYNYDGIDDIRIICTNNVPREYLLILNDSLRVVQTISANYVYLASSGLFTLDYRSIPDDKWTSRFYTIGEKGNFDSAYKLVRSNGRFSLRNTKSNMAVQTIGKQKEFLAKYSAFEEDVDIFLEWYWANWRSDRQ